MKNQQQQQQQQRAKTNKDIDFDFAFINQSIYTKSEFMFRLTTTKCV